jgi:hypothetical protein
VAGSRLLGIDFGGGGADREANQALTRAGVGTWLDAQIDDGSAEIAEPPAALREYLEQNRDAFWSVVAALERDEPEWGPAFGENGLLLMPFLPVLRLERALVTAALVEEKEGRSIEAGRALEAAWVLARSISLPTNIMTLSIGVGAERMTVGALRKMRAPPLQWTGRLSSDGPWTRIAEALRTEGTWRREGSDELEKMDSELAAKSYAAMADFLEKRTPCDPVLGSDQDIWKPAIDALAAETNAMKRSLRDFHKENMVGVFAASIRRAARLEVDREMTLKVLQLRLEKEASRDGAWPEKTDTTSAVCPEASYAYASTPDAMTLRFLGTVEAPKGSLPLTFREASPEVAEPKKPPALTPTPAGGMIAPP